MKLKLLFLGLLFLLQISSFAQQYPVSDSCRISLLTCTPGDELYSCFGHSGIRVKDPAYNIDLVFNYGTFDFNKPNFYVNFLKGIMIYSLGVDNFEDFNYNYIYEERGISEQVLNLTAAQKSYMVNFLMNNAKTENRDYRYDFLNDNCATRIRDVIEKTVGEKLQYDFSKWDTTKTFRYLIDEYSADKRWENLGMNLLIGLPVDKPTTPRQQVFLPDYLSQSLGDAKVLDTTNQLVSFAFPKREILARPALREDSCSLTPEILFSILLALIALVSFLEFRIDKRFKYLDFILFFGTGIMGLLMLNLWLFTEHWTTARNLNLLWAVPTNLLLSFLFLRKKLNSFSIRFAQLTLLVEIFFLAFHWFLPQHFQLGMFCIATILIIRLTLISVQNKISESPKTA